MSNVKEYLSQAFHIDKQLKSKLEQLSVLRELATTTTQPLSDMPGSPNRNIDRMENAIIKIMDMENENVNQIGIAYGGQMTYSNESLEKKRNSIMA